jgi:prepilin-type processing-associated H-X9-DG protein
MTDTPTDSPEHPERKGVKCELCGKLADVEEVTTVRGRFYCRDCAEAGRALDELEPFREKYDSRAIRLGVLGCGIALIVFVLGTTVLLIISFMRLDTPMACKTNMVKIYRVIEQYAGSGAQFPPANNDLRPVYGPDLRLHWFECPGTTNTVTMREQLKDDSASSEGPGMSYFYQGGYSYPIEEEDAALPLLWDQGLANHKGRGANVLFKDGHHEYWRKKTPTLVAPGTSRPVDAAGTPE